jgi:hypothetical protein
MIETKLVGANTCRRYKLMRELVLDETARAGIEMTLLEETAVERILISHGEPSPVAYRRQANRTRKPALPPSLAKAFEGSEMKKALVLPLTAKELQELYRILIDRDENGALQFLSDHARVPLQKALEGG